MGLNVGGTWNTTDVQNKTSVGWGLILGKSYGFKSYSPFTFDIRARYLRGFWYGQDYDTSSLSGYSGTALSGYTNQGLTVHNFQSDVHRLGLELAIHLNSITTRNGWDPYIFGGIGFTWHQAFSDLYNQNDSSKIYDYSSMINSGSLEDQINNNLDEIYDTPLDGYNKSSYNVAFMPSLGFGLGYHIGKRTTLGIEHKTTFTLRDDFDGLNSSVRAKNDLYHYTSMYLRFRFRGNRPNGNVSNVPCNSPFISVINPTQNQTVTNPQFTIQATVSEVRSLNQISIISNTGVSIPFDYNFSTKSLTANVLLVPGMNSYTIRVTTKCGSDSKVAGVNFLNCSLPSATFTNPINNALTVKNNAYTLTASVNGISNIQGVKLFQNGISINGFSYNPNNGLLQASVTLKPGVNNFAIELYNACGNNTSSASVNYDNCVTPSISLISPSSTGSTVNNATLNISTLITGITDKSQINISQNNMAQRNLSFSNGKMDFTTTLTPGINTFVINVNNSCGSANETFTINYQTCNAPVVNLEYPTVTGTNLNNSSLSLKAKVYNVDSRQNISVSVNGLAIKNVNFNKSTNSIEVPISLQLAGNNTITITATNQCGADVESSTVIYNPCTSPVIGLSSMSSNVNNSAYNFSANITNQLTTDGLSLTLNGNPINYSFSNSAISSSVNLQNGINTFVLTAVNACGRDSKTWTVTNNNCITPSISLENPTATGITVNTSTFQFKATINGMSTSQGVSLLFNNVPVTLNYQNGIISNNLNLVNGPNIIKLSVQNSCGSDNEEIVVNYQTCDAPGLTINQPIGNNTTVSQSSIQLNTSVTNVANNQGITVKLNGIGIPFQYNNGLITSTINLQPGANTVLISAANSCGTDVKALSINYDNCVLPQVQITNTQTTTNNSSLLLNATLSGSNLNQGTTLLHNGNIVSHNLNGNNLTANLILNAGSNVITLSSVNSCGSDSKTYTINYTPCLPPTLIISNPASNNLTFNTGSFTFQAEATNVNSVSEISLIVNGLNFPNFTFSSGQIVANIVLTAGQNTIKISTTTSCGSDSKSISIIGKSCDAPVLTITSPNNNKANIPSYSLQANVLNVTSSQGISISSNGSMVTNYSLNNGVVSAVINLTNGTNTIVILATNECGNTNQEINISYNPVVEEEKITICHIPPGNPNNPQTIEIPASAWPAHQAHGDVIGACPENNNGNSNGSNGNGSNDNNNSNSNGNSNGSNGNNNNNSSNANGNSNQEEEKITICHIPPGNPNNPQTIEIPASAWPAHQAHGDVIGACPENNNGNSNGSNGNGSNDNNNSNSNGNNNNNSSNANGNSNQEEEKITICHIPPGNPNNPETIEIPASAWPAHQAHGDVLGACPENSNGNNNSSNNNGNGNSTPQTLTICHKHQGRMGNDETMVITPEDWPLHEAHGDVLGSCNQNNTDNSNGSNGNGSNDNNNSNSNGNNNNNSSNDNGNSNSNNNSSTSGGENGNGSNTNSNGSDNSNSNNNSSSTSGDNGNVNGSNANSNGIDNSNSNNNSSNTGENNGNASNSNSNDSISSGNNNNNSSNSSGEDNNGNSNGNNGHGNNTDGVDVSNPGQGNGGPNGTVDQSGNIDDENNGNITGSNGNIENSSDSTNIDPNMNSNGQNSNSNENNGNQIGNENQNMGSGSNNNSNNNNSNSSGNNNSNQNETNGTNGSSNQNNNSGSGSGNDENGNSRRNQQSGSNNPNPNNPNRPNVNTNINNNSGNSNSNSNSIKSNPNTGNSGSGTNSNNNSNKPNTNSNINKPNTNSNINKPNPNTGNSGSGTNSNNNSNKPNTNSNINKPNTNSNINKPNPNTGNSGSGTNSNNNSNKPNTNSNINKPNPNTGNSGSGSNSNSNVNKPKPNVNQPSQGNQPNPNNKPKPENKGSEDKKPETPKIKKG